MPGAIFLELEERGIPSLANSHRREAALLSPTPSTLKWPQILSERVQFKYQHRNLGGLGQGESMEG